MPDNKFLDVAEFGHREISSERSLHTFFADNTETYVSFLDHGNVVSSITNACNNFTSALFDLDRNDSFLSWTASTNTNSLGGLRDIKEFLTKLLIRNDNTQGGSINHQHMSRGQVFVVINFFVNPVDLNFICDYLDIFIPILQSSRYGNALSCLNFVSSEHPNL